MTVDEANDASLHRAVGRDEEPCRGKMNQAGEARAMIDEEAGAKRSLARHRLPARAMRTMAVEPDEGHDAFADRAWYG